MPPPRICRCLLPQLTSTTSLFRSSNQSIQSSISTNSIRLFTSSIPLLDWLAPKVTRPGKVPKGRPRVATGGSTRGTTVAWGDYGLRMVDKHRRISAAQLKVGEDAIRQRLRGLPFRIYRRVAANIGVYKSGNDQRMGKGKGAFDHWATRVAVSQIVFEVSGEVHEQVVRDALRLAGNKLPGLWEFVKKGDPPVMGITKLGDGVTAEELKRPRRKEPLHPLHRLPDGTRAGESVASSSRA